MSWILYYISARDEYHKEEEEEEEGEEISSDLLNNKNGKEGNKRYLPIIYGYHEHVGKWI